MIRSKLIPWLAIPGLILIGPGLLTAAPAQNLKHEKLARTTSALPAYREAADGLIDRAMDAEETTTSAKTESRLTTSAAPGEVNISQFGVTERLVARNNGLLAIRFDPPFDPPYTITKISFPYSVPNATCGPASCRVSASGAIDGTAWLTPANLFGAGATTVTVATGVVATQAYKTFNLGNGSLAQVSGPIVGIQVNLNAARRSAGDATGTLAVRIRSLVGATGSKPVPVTGTNANYVLGGPTDLWGQSWTAADFLNLNFRFDLVATGPTTAAATTGFSADAATITVFYRTPGKFIATKLTGMNASGLPDFTNVFHTQSPVVVPKATPGVVDVPLSIVVTQANQSFFWVAQFPPAPASADSFPFLTSDITDTERGLFANAYSLESSGLPTMPEPVNVIGGILIDRNIAATMTCQVGANDVPIVAPSNFGANRRDTKTDFSYDEAPNVGADGFAVRSLYSTILLRRIGNQWQSQGSALAGNAQMELNSLPAGIQFWAVQALDNLANRSVQSNVSITGLNEDADEPNGKAVVSGATQLTLPVVSRPETYSPAGDQDFFLVDLAGGSTIDASAVATGQDNLNNLDLVMFLTDYNGNPLALDDDSNGGLNPRLMYTTPANPPAAKKYFLLVTDARHTSFDPTTAPRVVLPPSYELSVNAVLSPTAMSQGANSGHGELDGDALALINTGSNPAKSEAKLAYVIPRTAGSGSGVKLRIYDVNGRMIRTLVDGAKSAGPHFAVWEGRDDRGRSVTSGLYFALLESGAESRRVRISLFR